VYTGFTVHDNLTLTVPKAGEGAMCSFSVNPVGGLMVSLLALRVDDCGFDFPIRSSQRLRFAVRLLSTQRCGVRAKAVKVNIMHNKLR
jgi:hypothetical protein